MALGDFTYGTISRVQALVGDLVTSRVFTTGTVPKLAEVEAILDDIAAEINAELQGARYTLETNTNLTTNQPRVQEYLRAINSFGAAADVLNVMPAAAFTEGIEETGGGRADALRARYNRGLKLIREGKLAMTRPAVRVKVGSQSDSDTGETKLPIFTRSLTDFPGTRSLTEP